MQVHTNSAGEVVAVGSINHSELARLQAAAKKRKASAESKPKPERKPEPKSEPKSEPKLPLAPAKPS